MNGSKTKWVTENFNTTEILGQDGVSPAGLLLHWDISTQSFKELRFSPLLKYLAFQMISTCEARIWF